MITAKDSLLTGERCVSGWRSSRYCRWMVASRDIQPFIRGLSLGLLVGLLVTPSAFAQTGFTWQEIRARFEATNPTLQADQIGIDESKANEITAFLRPNPQFSLLTDQIGHNTESRPLAE